jgi:methylmalonyl-CoA/ethylmalonyl-CoA epimerase
MNLLFIDHISIAVKNLKKAIEKYKRALDITPDDFYKDDREKINVARYNFGKTIFELMESTDKDGEVAKFIRNKGEGIFLISFRIDNVEEAMKGLKNKGISVIDEKPRKFRERNYTFIHPKELCGVLVELID